MGCLCLYHVSAGFMGLFGGFCKDFLGGLEVTAFASVGFEAEDFACCFGLGGFLMLTLWLWSLEKQGDL